MEQHPVPQQISSYEFRLIGDMTLKQFVQVAAGFILAIAFYALPLPFFLKIPIASICAFLGLAFAFFPYEERPLQTWIIAFFKAVYSPTQFLWRKNGQKPAFFEEKTLLKMTTTAALSKVTTPDAHKLNDYLEVFHSSKITMDEKETSFVEQIQNLFSSVTLPPLPATPSYPIISGLKPEPRREDNPSSPSLTQTPVVVPRFPEERFLRQNPSERNLPRYHPPLPGSIPRKSAHHFEEAHFTPQIPMPSVPTIPNVLVGMILDTAGKMVEGAIVEIRDSEGNPVRAFRSNKLGQFRIVTPLPNDNYEIEIEKTGLKFDIIKLTLDGQIVQPIEIKAKNEAL